MTHWKRYTLIGCAVAVAATLLVSPGLFATDGPDWHFNGTVIEACSCPMFCQCYFNTEPASHPDHDGKHFCMFNMAYKVNKGHHGETDLAGVKFWVAGDLGADWSQGETEWAIVTFAPGTSDAQKAGIATALGHIFPVKWKEFAVAEDAEIEWTANDDRAEAKLAGGKNGHIILNKWDGMGGDASKLQNVAYFGAARNDGFKMMPNEIETWKVGDKAFEFSGTTGFMITIDSSSADLSD